MKISRLYKRIYLDSKIPLHARLDLIHLDSKIIYIDISSMVSNEDPVGIQRVMKIILQILTKKYSDEFLIIPTYFYRGFCYCSYAYARKFNNVKLLNFIKKDMYLENMVAGSIFLRIDINFFLSMSKKIANWLMQQKRNNVFFVQIIHDLIPIKYPNFTEEIYAVEFAKDLKASSLFFDVSIAVSKTVMDEYQEWLKLDGDNTKMKSAWIHWGGDIDKYDSHEVPVTAEDRFKYIDIAEEYFLMVSRIEPRKDYTIVIDAFEELWRNGYDESLIIVGKESFKTQKLIKRIKAHPLLNKKLFWLNYGVTDSELTHLYANSRAFIMSSLAEGFGLGIAEAVKHHKPLILRDIPVFHEIAENAAYYFSSSNGKDLAHEILRWEDLYKNNVHPKSTVLKVITWEQSCDRLMEIITSHVNDKILY